MELAKIKERADGKWHVTFLDKEVLFTKNLAWVKSNVRRNAKIRKLDLRKFEVLDSDGKVVEVFNLDGKSVKTEKIKPKKVKKVVSEIKKQKIITVIGETGTMLEGYNAQATVVNRVGRTIILEFNSKTNDLSVSYEFDAKTGIQKTDNPYHVWKIEDLSQVI